MSEQCDNDVHCVLVIFQLTGTENVPSQVTRIGTKDWPCQRTRIGTEIEITKHRIQQE